MLNINTHTRIVQIRATVEKERDRRGTRRSTKRTEEDYEYCGIAEFLDLLSLKYVFLVDPGICCLMLVSCPVNARAPCRKPTEVRQGQW